MSKNTNKKESRKELEGKKAPKFCLKNQNKEKVCLKDILGSLDEKGFVLVYFYPKDNTPGCTKEAIAFSKLKRSLSAAKVKVFGISILDEESKLKFAKKHNIKIDLLADPNHKIAEKYGVWKEKNMYGKKVFGISRESFLIDKSGKIVKYFKKVKPEEHAKEVLEFVKELRKK